jgi:hypothetical protein
MRSLVVARKRYWTVTFAAIALMLISGALALAKEDADADGDGLPDDWEKEHFGNLEQTQSGDPDQDGKDNATEYKEKTDPTDPDTDGDGITDGSENLRGLDPNDPDMDNDDKTDGEEDVAGTSHTDPDSDDDGYTDGFENKVGSKPNDPKSTPKDLDGDGRPNSKDAFPRDPTQMDDKDGDGHGDNPGGKNPDAFPDDPTKWSAAIAPGAAATWYVFVAVITFMILIVVIAVIFYRKLPSSLE